MPDRWCSWLSLRSSMAEAAGGAPCSSRSRPARGCIRRSMALDRLIRPSFRPSLRCGVTAARIASLSAATRSAGRRDAATPPARVHSGRASRSFGRRSCTPRHATAGTFGDDGRRTASGGLAVLAPCAVAGHAPAVRPRGDAVLAPGRRARVRTGRVRLARRLHGGHGVGQGRGARGGVIAGGAALRPPVSSRDAGDTRRGFTRRVRRCRHERPKGPALAGAGLARRGGAAILGP